MSAVSSIEWTDRTWNPVRGCSRVSPGCDHCYAMHFAHRFSGDGGVYEGLTVFRPKTAKRPGVDWSGSARFVPEMLGDPFTWRKPQRVFVNSMSDLFHESLSNEEIAAVFGVMAAAPKHTFQILTKRPERAALWFSWLENQVREVRGGDGEVRLCITAADRFAKRQFHVNYQQWPLPNVWLGVSVETQATADRRIPHLLGLPAALRFISAEPLLGPLDLGRWLNVGGICECSPLEKPSERCEGKGRKGWIRCNAGMRRLNWVIVGGESGHGARPFDTMWARSIVEQCGSQLGMGKDPWPVPVFVKQLGSKPMQSLRLKAHRVAVESNGARVRMAIGEVSHSSGLLLEHGKGADMAEWPEDLRVRQFPEVRHGR